MQCWSITCLAIVLMSFTQFHLLGITDMDLPKEQSQKTVVKKSVKSKSAAALRHRIEHKISKRSSESTSRERSHKLTSTKKISDEKRDPKITYKIQKKHRLELMERTLSDGEELKYVYKGNVQLKGKKMGSGILCSCCNEVVSPTTFERHAGKSSIRKPYQHILLKNGMSLHQYASSIKPNRKLVACVLCRSSKFSADGFSDHTSIICDQCEKEYHIGCLRSEMKIDLKELPPGNWFCTTECESLYYLIKLSVSLGPQNAMDYYMEIIHKKLKGCDADSPKNLDVKWIVLNGKDACQENKLLLTQAVDIFHDCFDPITNEDTGDDFIPPMAYGKQMGLSDFSGVYTTLLTVNSKVITAGMFRAFGCEFAELSIVATSRPNQGKGFLQVFFMCFERLLSYLKIKRLLIPAAENAIDMWTKKFGFKKVPPKMITEYRQTQTSMVEFRGTTLLQKDVPQGLCSFEKEFNGPLDTRHYTSSTR